MRSCCNIEWDVALLTTPAFAYRRQKLAEGKWAVHFDVSNASQNPIICGIVSLSVSFQLRQCLTEWLLSPRGELPLRQAAIEPARGRVSTNWRTPLVLTCPEPRYQSCATAVIDLRANDNSRIGFALTGLTCPFSLFPMAAFFWTAIATISHCRLHLNRGSLSATCCRRFRSDRKPMDKISEGRLQTCAAHSRRFSTTVSQLIR